MQTEQRRKVRSLLHDERGSVFVEYLVVAALGIAITGALVGLRLAVTNAQTRATEVLQSDVP